MEIPHSILMDLEKLSLELMEEGPQIVIASLVVQPTLYKRIKAAQGDDAELVVVMAKVREGQSEEFNISDDGALLFRFIVNALPYDYSASIQCLGEPPKPQYNGGIVGNPELNAPLGEWWKPFGEAKIEHRESPRKNKFIVACDRKHPFDSFSQKFFLQNSHHYTLSAWIQVNHGIASVRAIFKTNSGFKHAGIVTAKSECWSMLKGGLTMDNSSAMAELYFESENTTVEIWADSISLQPFTDEEWRSHQRQSIEKTRKRRVKFHATDAQGNPLANATISIKQTKLGFPFGCAMNKNILTNTAYKNWFTSRFAFTTFENEMKWYSTELSPGKEDYSVADAMLEFTKANGISTRGHNVLWDDANYQPEWVKSLSPAELAAAASRRIESIMTRYAGKVIAWDVVNENIHFSFFEDKLGKEASPEFYRRAFQLDKGTTMFLNEFNTIEEPRDETASPGNYIQKLKEILDYIGKGNIDCAGIGLEGHFGETPNLPYMRSAIDLLAATGARVWITELDVRSGANQAEYLEQIIREAHAHEDIEGIVMWAAWSLEGCYQMCLTDNDFKNLATGDVVDKLISEWTHGGFLPANTDAQGFFETSLFHGDYQVAVTMNMMNMNSSISRSFKVASALTASPEKPLLVTLSPA
ncbi:endo-1,4-beta-xylanase 5-like [Malania oleifera]|uniref:endo-1,4-beta-xylanase 5-like n=1 Tax=Malania oleifera TaxID=397392 RepID=UPI0025AE6E1B|nr:endo-1,4-beta-xylanase 5-like [Malania oleifera]